MKNLKEDFPPPLSRQVCLDSKKQSWPFFSLPLTFSPTLQLPTVLSDLEDPITVPHILVFCPTTQHLRTHLNLPKYLLYPNHQLQHFFPLVSDALEYFVSYLAFLPSLRHNYQSKTKNSALSRHNTS